MGLFAKKKKGASMDALVRTGISGIKMYASELGVSCVEEENSLVLNMDGYNVSAYFGATEDTVYTTFVSMIILDPEAIPSGGEWEFYQELLGETDEILHHPFAMDRNEDGEIRLYFRNIVTYDDVVPLTMFKEELIYIYVDVKNLSEALDSMTE